MRVFGVAAAIAVAGVSGAAAQPVGELSVLTYNVEGLPFPARIGRGHDLDRIADTLTAMRRDGRQPHVVVLQEAFSATAKDVARRAGYRYVVEGLGPDAPRAPATTAAERAFVAAGTMLHGEGLGTWVGSGLLIASDYPLVGARAMAYPDFACAGFDCLANKGVLLARVRVPGSTVAVTVVATHLNSGFAARVPYSRSLVAYRAQVDALSGFIDRNVDGRSPVIVAGDFNVGQRALRRAYLVARAAQWTPPRLRTVLASCTAACRSQPADLAWMERRSRDWQFYGSEARGAALQLVGLSAPFGRQADGTMLSDHVGYVARYRLVGPGVAPLVVAQTPDRRAVQAPG